MGSSAEVGVRQGEHCVILTPSTLSVQRRLYNLAKQYNYPTSGGSRARGNPMYLVRYGGVIRARGYYHCTAVGPETRVSPVIRECNLQTTFNGFDIGSLFKDTGSGCTVFSAGTRRPSKVYRTRVSCYSCHHRN